MKTCGFTPSRESPKANPWVILLTILGIFTVIFTASLGPLPGGLKQNREGALVQTAHALGLALYSYSNDNNQTYPEGASSTEAFQKLIDGGYVTDPAIFYIPMPGKVKAVAGQKLKPENVCWDLTAGVDATSPTHLPLLFMTGYKIHYAPGGSAVPLHGIPQYGHAVAQALWEKWLGFSPKIAYGPFNGIPAFYANLSASFAPVNSTVAPDGSIPNFVSPDFKSDGRTYRQLTPDGVLQ